MKKFSLLLLTMLLVPGYCFADNDMAKAIGYGYKCRASHDEPTINFGMCVQQFTCERSGVSPVFISTAAPLDQQKECPSTAEDYIRRSAIVNKTAGIVTVRIEARANPKNDVCSPFPVDYDTQKTVSLGQVVEGKTTHRYCIVGAKCSNSVNAEKRQGVVTCSPKPETFDEKVIGGKTYKFPVCRDFDDCLVHNLAAPKNLLTAFLKKEGTPGAVTSTVHAPVSNSTAALSAGSRHVDSLVSK